MKLEMCFEFICSMLQMLSLMFVYKALRNEVQRSLIGMAVVTEEWHADNLTLKKIGLKI